jgi:hypothetical protein
VSIKEAASLKLYWVTTEDHEEDWFVIAPNANDAASFHEDAKGYAIGDATAELVMEIPDGVEAELGWPSDDILRECGAVIFTHGPSRVVKIGDRTFSEGLMEATIRALDDDVSELLGRGRPNKTPRTTEH